MFERAKERRFYSMRPLVRMLQLCIRLQRVPRVPTAAYAALEILENLRVSRLRKHTKHQYA